MVVFLCTKTIIVAVVVCSGSSGGGGYCIGGNADILRLMMIVRLLVGMVSSCGSGLVVWQYLVRVVTVPLVWYAFHL